MTFLCYGKLFGCGNSNESGDENSLHLHCIWKEERVTWLRFWEHLVIVTFQPLLVLVFFILHIWKCSGWFAVIHFYVLIQNLRNAMKLVSKISTPRSADHRAKKLLIFYSSMIGCCMDHLRFYKHYYSAIAILHFMDLAYHKTKHCMTFTFTD